MGRSSVYDSTAPAMVIKVMKQGGSIIEVCATLGIGRRTFYNWLDKPGYEDFTEAVDVGLVHAQAWWENIIRDQMTNPTGIPIPAWIFVMKSRFREDYKEDAPKMVVPVQWPLAKSELDN